MDAEARRILILGASYGSLLASKLLLAGHSVTLACRRSEAELISAEGIVVRIPVRALGTSVQLQSKELPGHLSAEDARSVDANGFDLAVLAMQEPQYSHPDIRRLVADINGLGIPCLSIMNIPLPPYLARLPKLQDLDFESCFTDAAIWRSAQPRLMTMCSADPQAARPPDCADNEIHVGLPTNFRAANFGEASQAALLKQLENDIDCARLDVDGHPIDVPVRLRVHDSIYVPFSKWPMLMTGNYRCLTTKGMRSIGEAVLSNLRASERMYGEVADVVLAMGASVSDIVPFEKYVSAAVRLKKPSSAARSLSAGAVAVERVDRLIQSIAHHLGRDLPFLDEIVATVDSTLAANRANQAAAGGPDAAHGSV